MTKRTTTHAQRVAMIERQLLKFATVTVGLAPGGGTLVTLIGVITGAILFAILVQILFDPMIVIGSSLSGAALVMDGLVLILPFLGWFLNRANALQTVAIIPVLVWFALAAIGIAWQFGVIRKFVM